MSDVMFIPCAHGTKNAEGQTVIREVMSAASVKLGVPWAEAYVDVHGPYLADVLAELPEGQAAVVVPILLSGGYHVYVDIDEAVAAYPRVIATPALGPDERLVDLLLDRLHAVGADPTDPVVFAPAGSSDPRSQRDAEETRSALSARWAGTVTTGNAATLEPSAADAVAALPDEQRERAVVASYLLAPGFFQHKLEKIDGVRVTSPLAPDARITAIIVERFNQAVQRLTSA